MSSKLDNAEKAPHSIPVVISKKCLNNIIHTQNDSEIRDTFIINYVTHFSFLYTKMIGTIIYKTQ